MDSEDEQDHEQDHEEEHNESGEASATLTGFLFGNVNKKGELESDVLDEESKRHLNGLNTINAMGTMVKEIADNENEDDSQASGDESDVKAVDSAIDYSDIQEVADEEEEKIKDALTTMKPKEDEGDDYDDEEESKDTSKLMPPPSWIPRKDQVKQEDDKEGSDSGSPTKKLNTPLAAMLPPAYADKDVKEIFPEFRPGQVLRFSRLFKPAHKLHIWKKKKKVKSEEVKKEDDKKEDEKKDEKKETVKQEPDSIENDQLINVVDDVLPSSETTKPELEIKSEPVEEEYEWKMNWHVEVKPEDIMEDDAVAMLRTKEENSQKDGQDGEQNQTKKPEIADWRYGPAQLWYDMLGVDDAGEDFDYGLKCKEEAEEESEEQIQRESVLPPVSVKVEYPDEAFHMVTQVNWEDDIIWNGEDVKQKVLQSFKQKGAAAGWVASSSTRTAAQYLQQVNGSVPPMLVPVSSAGPMSITSLGLKLNAGFPQSMGQTVDNSSSGESSKKNLEWYSIFPVENEDLLYTRWEDNIIWDAKKLDKIPLPKCLSLDPNDENIIMAIPEDRDPNAEEQDQSSQAKEKKEVKKSKILLGKAGLIKEEDEEEEEEDDDIAITDPFNLSNDQYYNPKLASDSLRNNLGGSVVQNSTPAMELRQPFFPTHFGPIKLRNFHRNPLKKYSHGALAMPGPHPVLPLMKTIKRKQKMRDQERLASGGGDMFFMRTPEDLTGKDGDLILCEFSEEHPPLMMQVGMSTKIKNFYKRRPGKDANPPEFKYGELSYAHSSPFIGQMAPGQCLPALDNNMFRAPIYQHKVPDTDFLIIRTRQHFYIRDLDTIFTIGQSNPLMEVPGPNSKKANNFIRDFLQVFIYRLFWKSKDTPRRIKMEEIKKAFPSHSESSIRKRLKLCADFKRTGVDSNWWVLKPDFRLPSEEEMRAMVSPEQCCGYYSMLAAEQRLKDAGYGEKSLFALDDDNEDDKQEKMDEEVLAAPWNTTRAYIHAMKGKCLLALTGPADPTGCGEGFSYIKVPNKPVAKGQQDSQEQSNTPQKKTVTGTDADLRRLNLKDAKVLLKKFGVAESEIKKLSRWEVIDVVRTMSTQQAKAGQEGMTKFARGNRFSIAEHQERYKEECQRIFDLQNNVLSSKEVLSTDEESSDEDDSDFEEMGKNIENMLSNKKTSSQIEREREEAGRKDLQRMIREGRIEDKKKKDKGEEIPNGVRKLKITRTFCNTDGNFFTRSETVTKAPVIDTYVKIRQTKDPNFIRQFATLDDAQKEEMKKERRRLQEQLRRIQRNQEKVKEKLVSPKVKHSSKKKKDLPQLKLKCGACGQMGHMRTNKECPLFAGIKSGPKEKEKVIVPPVAPTEEELEEEEKSHLVDEELINVEGTKMKFSKTLLEHASEVRRKSLVLKFPKKITDSRKRRRAGTVVHCDYLKKQQKSTQRRRADPVVTLSSIFESILNEMRDVNGTQHFHTPVNSKHYPTYYNVIEKPMDLQTIRENVRNRKYQSREPFVMDVSQIVSNSEIFNGSKSVLTVSAKQMLDLCLERLAEKEEKLMRLEKAINPLLDDNDIVAFTYILSTIIEDRLKVVDNSHIFHKPVNRKVIKDYYDIIKNPMDLETLLKNVKSNQYKTVASFIDDVELIASNSTIYNGEANPLTKTAIKMVDTARAAIKEQEETLQNLEMNIQATEEAALDAAETESFLTATSTGAGNDWESIDGSVKQEPPPAKKSKKKGKMHETAMIQNTSREDEFVDIEGDEEMMHRTHDDSNSLAQDLQMTPENSDDDEVAGNAGSDYSEQETMEFEEVDSTFMEQSQTQYLDENAQDYSQQASFVDDPEGENSFDPDAFFSSLQQQGSQQGAPVTQDEADNGAAGIDADLQVSDSEDEDEEFEDVPIDDSATVGDESNTGFDMGEFLQ